jgi:hypothetical protein
MADDLIAVVESCFSELEGLTDRDWTARAGPLEWTCRETLEHLATLAYGAQLAARARTFKPLALSVTPGASIGQLLWTMKVLGLQLAEVARAAPPTVRAFHPAGMADPSGFVAMGMDELLVHTHDIATGLGVPFKPDDGMARLVLNRLFPWWPQGAAPWAALLWANGRAALPGHDNPGAAWLWHCAPVEDWDGTVPRWDPAGGRPTQT